MINVLINAYAVSPTSGSEPGMGWNWIIYLSDYCNLYVITEGEWQKEIEETLESIPHKRNNIHFYYIPVSSKIRKMCWNQGDWRFYIYYRKWQAKALLKAKQICSEREIDILHQLNMVGYREPGMLWKIKNIPTVWGPIGGFGEIPISYLSIYTFKESVKQIVKQCINRFQIFVPYILQAVKKTTILVACNSVAKKSLEIFRSDYIPVIGEVGGFEQLFVEPTDKYSQNRLIVTWIGKNDSRKALILALKTFEKLSSFTIELHVIGVDYESAIFENKEKLKNVFFHPWMPLVEVHKHLSQSHIFLFSSLFEATGTVVLEALSFGVPVVCHDTCGQGDIVDETCGIKIPMKGIQYSIDNFKNAIVKLHSNRELLKELSQGAFEKSKTLSWVNKSKQMVQIYHSLLNTGI
jgi:glycosyltransferase involved in cell wall biosynthesis